MCLCVQCSPSPETSNRSPAPVARDTCELPHLGAGNVNNTMCS